MLCCLKLKSVFIFKQQSSFYYVIFEILEYDLL